MDWFASSLGADLLESERARVQQLLPPDYYPRALQVGRSSVNFLRKVECGERFLIDENVSAASSDGKRHPTRAHASAMPFADKTHNLIILPHTLDFCADPHSVLREVNHILIPQGCVAITGFNGLSLWGAHGLAMKLVKRIAPQQSPSSPWHARNQRVGQVQDWLSLLGFDLVGAAMLGYQPPLQNEKWRKKLTFLDHAGARWWPRLGAAYIIVGRKREIAMRGNLSVSPAWRQLLPRGMVQPAARVPLKLVKVK